VFAAGRSAVSADGKVTARLIFGIQLPSAFVARLSGPPIT
jgi:hypothetical protein